MENSSDADNSMQEARTLFQQATSFNPDAQKRALLALWQRCSSDELFAFIQEEKQQLFQGLTNQFTSEVIPSSDPWTIAEMNQYYTLRLQLDKPEIHDECHLRRQHVITGHYLTSFDDLQLSRETAETVQLKKAHYLGSYIDHLELLSHAQAVLSPEQPYTYYFFDYLFQLLDIYRIHLQTSTPDKTIVFHIDAIAIHIAHHFHNAIISHSIEKQRPAFQAMLTRIGALNQEIFPWLSIFFYTNTPSIKSF